MITFLTCDGYAPIATFTALEAPADLAAKCRELEEERADGFAVIATSDGRIVADADGPAEPGDDRHTYRAQIDHACGYVD